MGHDFNNSWGGGGFSSNETHHTSRDSESPFVAAAGNSSNNIDTSRPIRLLIKMRTLFQLLLFNRTDLDQVSNYGTTNVDVVAPGSGIAPQSLVEGMPVSMERLWLHPMLLELRP